MGLRWLCCYLRAAPVADFSPRLSAPGLVLSHGVKWVEPGCSLWETTPACSSGLSAHGSELSCCVCLRCYLAPVLITSVVAGPVTPGCRLPRWFYLAHTAGSLACLCVSRRSLCPDHTPGCGMEWAGRLTLHTGTCGEVAASRPRRSLPWS